MKLKYLYLLVISVLVIGLDQATKLLVVKAIDLHELVPVVPGLFNLTYLHNRGAAFGILADSPYRLPFFLAVTLVSVLVLLYAIHRSRDDQRLAPFSLSLIFAGAVGNLIDRMRLGEVIDFLDVYWKEHHWPAFNVADSAICVGVALLAIDMLLEERRQKAAQPPSP
jgi:signal peptidase II